jgi:hypothetical protein
MLTKLRQIVASILSIGLVVISLGLLKPNFSGEPTLSYPGLNAKSTISIDINKDRNILF